MNLDSQHTGVGATSDVMSERSDGISVVLNESKMIVYGGWASERIWELSLLTLQWSEIETTGDIPAPRLNHAASMYAHQMLITGGELLNRSSTQPLQLPHFELDMNTYEWMELQCAGNVPLARSNHTSVVLRDSLIICGGKPISAGAREGTLSNSAMVELIRSGFYDVHLLHIKHRFWQRIELRDPITPMLWGHTASPYGTNMMIVFGGFDVSIPIGAQPTDAPSAELTSDIFILNLDTLRWWRHSPSLRPLERALHCALLRSNDLIIFGGFRFDVNCQAQFLNDCWRWDVQAGHWSRMDFCYDSWSSKKLLCGMYYDQLVVTNSLNHVCFYDLRVGGPWQKLRCTFDPHQWVQRSPIAQRNLQEQTKTTEGLSTTSSSAYMLKHTLPPRLSEIGPVPSEADLLRMEVQRLRSEVSSQALDHSKSSHSPNWTQAVVQQQAKQLPQNVASRSSSSPIRSTSPDIMSSQQAVVTHLRRSTMRKPTAPSPPPKKTTSYSPHQAIGSPTVMSPKGPRVRPVLASFLSGDSDSDSLQIASHLDSSPRALHVKPNHGVGSDSDTVPSSLVAYKKLRQKTRVLAERRKDRIHHLSQELQKADRAGDFQKSYSYGNDDEDELAMLPSGRGLQYGSYSDFRPPSHDRHH